MICLDTTFLIDLLRGELGADALSKELDNEPTLFTTEINVFEVVLGIFARKDINRQKEYEKAIELFRVLKILPLEHKAALEAGKLAGSLMLGGRQIDENDCLIAAITKTNGIQTIVTRNVAHYERTGMRVKTY